jgi:hypothetical protein
MDSKIKDLSRGVVFAAIGEKYINEAILSARSIRKKMPDLPICLFTEEKVDAVEFDRVEVLERSHEGFKGIKLYKPLALAHSPFNITLFLDSDTYVCSDCSELFDMTRSCELVIAHDTADMSVPIVKGREMANFYPYNSGVMCFPKSVRTSRLLTDWFDILEKEFDEHQWDQRALMASILKNKIFTYTLQPIYNCRTNFIVSLPQLAVKIIHGRDIDFEATEKELNRILKNRVWMPKIQKIMLKKPRGFFRMIFDKVRQRISR